MQTTIALAGAILASLVSPCQGHLIMNTPAPYGKGVIDNSPLTASNYPCKVTSDPATFYDTTKYPPTTMAQGETQTLSFTGSAVHGGGSCQLAVTSDMAPSATTSWQVILSIEGGCPTTDGNGPSTYDFTIPDTIAPGSYSFAWTWISKQAGQGEYYMNCAPITVTAGSSKRDEETTYDNVTLISRDTTLPELFVANVGTTINSCTTTSGFDYVYPFPGDNVSKPGSSPEYKDAPNTNCVPKGLTADSSGSSGSSASSSAGTPAASSSASSSAGTPAASSSASSGSGSGSGSGAAVPSSASTATTLSTSTTTSISGSVFVSPISSASTSVESASASTATTSSSPASKSAGTSSTAAATSTTKAGTSATGSAAGGSATGSGSSSTTGALSGACTTEGEWNCNGSTYQQCASGSWTAMSALPGGTTCIQGLSSSLWSSSKRSRNIMRRIRKGS